LRFGFRMKRDLARRTGAYASGLGKARDHGCPPTNATRTPICLGLFARNAAQGLPSCCPRQTPKPCLHLDEISHQVARKAHGAVLMDRAGGHTTGKLKVPKNLTIILLPSRSPELNPVENIWQYLRANWLCNRVFEDYNAIIDAGCEAWNRLIAQPETITSIELRN
jgi:transposase